MLLVTLLLPVSLEPCLQRFRPQFLYSHWPPAKPLAVAHGTLRFRGTRAL